MGVINSSDTGFWIGGARQRMPDSGDDLRDRACVTYGAFARLFVQGHVSPRGPAGL